MDPEPSRSDSSAQFAERSQKSRPSLASEFIAFLKHNKKWWLLPILAVMIFLGILMYAGGGAAAPFIYTIF